MLRAGLSGAPASSARRRPVTQRTCLPPPALPHVGRRWLRRQLEVQLQKQGQGAGGQPRVHFFNSFFYKKLTEAGGWRCALRMLCVLCMICALRMSLRASHVQCTCSTIHAAPALR